MEQSKKEFLAVLQGMKLSKTQSPTTAQDRKRMKVIPYASAIGSIMYAMMCTRPDVYLAISLAGRYIKEQEVAPGTAVKLTFSKKRICSSIMDVTKRFIVKSYIDASFDTDLDDSESRSGYILKVGAIR